MTIYDWEKDESDKENVGQGTMAGEKHAAGAGTTRKDTGKKGKREDRHSTKTEQARNNLSQPAPSVGENVIRRFLVAMPQPLRA
jgi:hypothetical protein